MRTRLDLLLPALVLILLTGCFKGGPDLNQKKDPVKPGVVAVEPQTHLVGPGQLSAIEELFRSNGLSLDRLVVKKIETDKLGFTHVRLAQTIGSLPVFLTELIYHFDQGGKLSSVSGEKIKAISLPTEPTITMEQAARIALTEIGEMARREPLTGGAGILAAELGFYDQTKVGSKDFVLVWKIKPLEREYPLMLIDAFNGPVLYSDSGIRY